MPIKCYTTTIDCNKTVGEIQAVLSKHGANQILIEYQAGAPVSLIFEISLPNDTKQSIKLPANIDRVHEVLKQEKIQPKLQTYEQAQKVAWRILKNWLDAQLALLEMNMVSVAQIMLPYFCSRNGETIYELYEKGNLRIE